MDSLKLTLHFTVFLYVLQSSFAAQKCVALRGSPLEGCSAAGYNQTFPLPSHLPERTRTWIKMVVTDFTTLMKNCSVVGVAETMACSVLAPYCKDGGSGPFLPCKRVCSEFLKRCSHMLPARFVDMMIAMCSLLPSNTATSGKCYEPPQFDKHYNISHLGPLERGCQKLIFPFCKNLSYNHTIVSQERQKTLFRVFYGKNYSETPETRAPTAPILGIEKMLANYSKCATNLKKIFCAEILPPCFPHEGVSFYTACKSVCQSIKVQCPDIYVKLRRFAVYCELYAGGSTSHGYCKHTSWPPPMDWPIWEDPPTTSPKPAGGMGSGLIAAIVVPIVVVGLIIGAVFFYKKRKITSLGYTKQDDDRADLVA